eukprot:4572068-Karenia_brevis.AAC.1
MVFGFHGCLTLRLRCNLWPRTCEMDWSEVCPRNMTGHRRWNDGLRSYFGILGNLPSAPCRSFLYDY